VKQTPSDDIEAFLLTFERTAKREEWPAEQWVGLIAPFLSDIAQNTYQDLATDPMITYTALKGEIMKRYGFTLITRAQRYHDWVFDHAATPRAQMHELVRLRAENPHSHRTGHYGPIYEGPPIRSKKTGMSTQSTERRPAGGTDGGLSGRPGSAAQWTAGEYGSPHPLQEMTALLQTFQGCPMEMPTHQPRSQEVL